MKKGPFIWILLSLYSPPSTLYVHAEPLAENQARLGVVTGDVGLLSQGAPEWVEVHEGLPLEPGDRIRTGEDGRVELVAGENALWVLEPATELVAEHMETNAGRFNLVSGTLIGTVDSARSAGTVQKWEFNTPVSVMAIRGTEFALEFSPPLHLGGSPPHSRRGLAGSLAGANASVAEKAEESRLGVFEGTVDLEPAETAQGLQPPVPVTAGQEAVSKRGHPIQVVSRFSTRMQVLAGKRQMLRRQQRRIQNTWSPFTPAVHSELRRKFVAPPPKRKQARPRAAQTHRISH